MRYLYGMRLRGFSPGCQPKEGLIGCREDVTGDYYDILMYDRELSERELFDYDLDFVGEQDDRII